MDYEKLTSEIILKLFRFNICTADYLKSYFDRKDHLKGFSNHYQTYTRLAECLADKLNKDALYDAILVDINSLSGNDASHFNGNIIEYYLASKLPSTKLYIDELLLKASDSFYDEYNESCILDFITSFVDFIDCESFKKDTYALVTERYPLLSFEKFDFILSAFALEISYFDDEVLEYVGLSFEDIYDLYGNCLGYDISFEGGIDKRYVGLITLINSWIFKAVDYYLADEDRLNTCLKYLET